LDSRVFPAGQSAGKRKRQVHFFRYSRAPRARLSELLAQPSFHPKFGAVSESVVKVDPEIMSGAPCFAGTRVPIQNLMDYLEGGDSIDEFLEDFPTVSRQQVISFLEEAKQSVLARAV
jgi:uncharacterized protein (DUF433 family)